MADDRDEYREFQSMRAIGLMILSLGLVPLITAVVIAAASGLIVLAVTLALPCLLLAPIGFAAIRAARPDDPPDTGILPGEATIAAVVDAGAVFGEDSEVVLDLDVRVPGQPEYNTTVATIVPRAVRSRCRSGRTVRVLIDPDDPTEVSVDWET